MIKGVKTVPQVQRKHELEVEAAKVNEHIERLKQRIYNVNTHS